MEGRCNYLVVTCNYLDFLTPDIKRGLSVTQSIETREALLTATIYRYNVFNVFFLSIELQQPFWHFWVDRLTNDSSREDSALRSFRHLCSCAHLKKRYGKTRHFHNLSKFHFFIFCHRWMNPGRQSKECQAVRIRTLNQLQYLCFMATWRTKYEKMNPRLVFGKLIFEAMTGSSREITMVDSSPILVSILACKWGESWIIWSLLLPKIQQIDLFLFSLTFFFSEGKITLSFFFIPFPLIT